MCNSELDHDFYLFHATGRVEEENFQQCTPALSTDVILSGHQCLQLFSPEALSVT